MGNGITGTGNVTCSVLETWKSHTKNPADDGIVCVHAHMIVSRRLWEAFVNQGS